MVVSRGSAPAAGDRVPVTAAVIAAAALELFARKGYVATTMEDIGAALGIRGPSLYKHVQSKQDLLVAIAGQGPVALLREQHQILARGGDVTRRLRATVYALVNYVCENRLSATVGRREVDHLSAAN